MRVRLEGVEFLWRRGLVAALLGLMALLLAACSGTVDPFGKDGPAAPPPKGKTPPAIIVRTIGGMPGDLARNLKVSLAVSAGQRDIGIVEGDLPGGTFTLEGVFSALPAGGATKVSYQWTLRDTAGNVVDQPVGEVTAPGGGGDPWAAVDTAVLQQIAEQTAQSLAIKLAAMGYATRLSALITPPTETFAMAGPGASQELDYETLNGPGAIDPASLAAGPAEMPAEDLAVAAPVPPPAAEVAGAAPAPEEPAAPAARKPVITAVAVLPVTGAPGKGNAELTQAMRDTLSAAGWPVIAKPRGDALTIAGKVKLATAADGSQTVKIAWLVSHPEGATLGDIRQSNAVPAGSLDQGFGAAAQAVAEAAATGIFDLIKTYR
jgi:predicted small secreted protein